MTRICFLMFTVFLFLLSTHAQNWEYDDYTDTCTTPDQKLGTCIVIHSCQFILDALKTTPKPIPPKVLAYLKKYNCGFEGRNPKVCCPESPIYLGGGQNTQQSLPDVSGHKNINLLPKNCGYLDTDSKIINGDIAGLFEFPWMALLSYQTRNGPQFKCGGSIINDRYILTAAHCLSNLKNPLLGVRVGEHNIRTIKDCEVNKWEGEICAPPYQDLEIEKIIVHPDYDFTSFSNDIGLIKVSPINLSLENSRPVCLPLGENRNYNFTNRNAFVTGWGITEKGIPSSELRKVALPVIPLEKCKDMYGNIAKIDDRQLCAGGKNRKDSCAGDSGGPLHVTGSLHGDLKLIQQGIVSFGPNNCGGLPIPGVYTKVAVFMDWILDNIET